jgi:hypothetical protein
MNQPTYQQLKDLGNRFYTANQWEQALAAYQEADGVDSTSAAKDDDLYFRRSYLFLALNRINESKQACEQCISLNPNHSAAWLNLGLCFRTMGQWAAANVAYQRAAELWPENTSCWEGLALCATELNDTDLRIKAAETLAKLEPSNSHRLNEVGRAHLASGHPSGIWKALAAWLESSRMDNDPCHPNNAAIVYRKLNKLLDAADAYREALHRKPGFSFSQNGLDEITPFLEHLSRAVREFAENQPACKEPYEKYLNPFEVLAVNCTLKERPDSTSLRKLKQRAIQQIQLNDGRADWLDGAEIGESRMRQVLDDLDGEDQSKAKWHWIIYTCPHLNRFLSHGDPYYFSFSITDSTNSALGRPPYWQIRDISREDEQFFHFITAPFLSAYENLMGRALELGNPVLVQALSSGRLPAIDAYDYFRRANQWLIEKARKVRECMDALNTPEGVALWEQSTDPLGWISIPLMNALPDECRAGRTDLGRTIRELGIALHNHHGLADKALKLVQIASQLQVDEALRDQLTEDSKALERILKTQEAEKAKWNRIIRIGSNEIVITESFISVDSQRLSSIDISGIAFNVTPIRNESKNLYLIFVRGKNLFMPINCTGSSRSEAQANEDFKIVLESIYNHFVPGLVDRLATRIISGTDIVSIGPLRLTANGIEFETGQLFWKKRQIFPYRSWLFSRIPGWIFASVKNTKIRFSLGTVQSNAIIIEEIVDAVIRKQVYG